MASSIYWPDSLPDGAALTTPLRAGYGYTQRNPSLRTDFGLVSRSRRIYSDAPAELSVGFVFTAVQWAEFEAFFWYELDAGNAWFWLPVRVGGSLELREVNFLGEMPQFQLLGVEYGGVTARLVTRKGSQMSPEDYAAAQVFGGIGAFIKMKNLLDYSVNTVIPKMFE